MVNGKSDKGEYIQALLDQWRGAIRRREATALHPWDACRARGTVHGTSCDSLSSWLSSARISCLAKAVCVLQCHVGMARARRKLLQPTCSPVAGPFQPFLSSIYLCRGNLCSITFSRLHYTLSLVRMYLTSQYGTKEASKISSTHASEEVSHFCPPRRLRGIVMRDLTFPKYQALCFSCAPISRLQRIRESGLRTIRPSEAVFIIDWGDRSRSLAFSTNNDHGLDNLGLKSREKHGLRLRSDKEKLSCPRREQTERMLEEKWIFSASLSLLPTSCLLRFV